MRFSPLLVIAALSSSAAFAQAPASAPPAPAAPTDAAPGTPQKLRVLVLDLKSADLSQSERETITSIVTTHLSKYPPLSVMSSLDIQSLANVEATRQAAGCDDASCLAEIAGALGAEIILYGQAGKLGGALIVTLNAYDSAKSAAIAREQVNAKDAGQLPSLLPPAVDRLIAPAFDVNTLQPIRDAMRSTGSSRVALDARGLEIFEARKFDLCIGNNKAQWFFCQKGGPVSENEFVREYRTLTGAADLDHAEVNRNSEGMLVPAALLGVGVVGLGVSVTSLVLTYAVQMAPLTAQSPLSSRLPLGLDIAIGSGLVGVGFLAWGVYETIDSLRFEDDPATAHTLSEAEGRAAAERYNAKLSEGISRELGAGTGK